MTNAAIAQHIRDAHDGGTITVQTKAQARFAANFARLCKKSITVTRQSQP